MAEVECKMNKMFDTNLDIPVPEGVRLAFKFVNKSKSNSSTVDRIINSGVA